MDKNTYDVVIVGGALLGGSTAYHLLKANPALKICVVERDPTYQRAPSAMSVAGIRVLFSQEQNLRMSRYGREFYTNFGDLMEVDGERQPLHFWKQGYLFIANTPEQAADMKLNYDFQISMGCEVELLDSAALSKRYPSIATHDIVVATLSPHDGWIDPYGALMGLRKKARSMGAEYRHAEVAGIQRDGHKVTGVQLNTNDVLQAGYVINCAGVWAPEVCKMVGMEIPVVPLPRTQFYFETQAKIEPLPLVRDQAGPGFRPEGAGFLSGLTNFESAGRFNWDVDYSYFDNDIWPSLANRVPAFEAVKVKNAWCGHYAQNVFDGNMIIGSWTGEIDNFLIGTGCSGHGLQHAPAAGRGLSELVLNGAFQTIDLSRLSFERVLKNKPYPERGVKA